MNFKKILSFVCSLSVTMAEICGCCARNTCNSIIRVIVVGDKGSGKSYLINKYVSFVENSASSVKHSDRFEKRNGLSEDYFPENSNLSRDISLTFWKFSENDIGNSVAASINWGNVVAIVADPSLDDFADRIQHYMNLCAKVDPNLPVIVVGNSINSEIQQQNEEAAKGIALEKGAKDFTTTNEKDKKDFIKKCIKFGSVYESKHNKEERERKEEAEKIKNTEKSEEPVSEPGISDSAKENDGQAYSEEKINLGLKIIGGVALFFIGIKFIRSFFHKKDKKAEQPSKDEKKYPMRYF